MYDRDIVPFLDQNINLREIQKNSNGYREIGVCSILFL
jgi:hypothetical protein